MATTLYTEPTPQTANCLNSIGTCYQKCGDLKNALEHKLAAYEMRKKVFENDEYSLDLADSMHSLAITYDSLNEFEKAQKLKLDSLRIREKHFKNKPSDILASNYNNIGVSYEKMGELKKAEEYFQKAYKMRKLLKGESSKLDMANSLHNLGVIKEKQRMFNEAKECFMESLHIKEDLFRSMNHFELANCLNALGSIYSKLNDQKTALAYSKRAYEMRVKMYEPDFPNHPEIQNSLYNLSIINERMGKKSEAYELSKRSTAIKSALDEEAKKLSETIAQNDYIDCKAWTHEQFLRWLEQNQVSSSIIDQMLSGERELSERLLGEIYELSLKDETIFSGKFSNVASKDLNNLKNCLKKMFKLKIKSNYVI